ncbi:DUF1146 domain-containing protein [Aerococcaceae bacterium DSM 111176]|nr:DUF1146 domain-containing protein [Aerococcaceae bacterium DSM 111176]
MMTLIYSMAVLVVRIVFVLLSYLVFSKLKWREAFSNKNYYLARWACILLSISVGYAVSSYFIEIIDIIRGVIFTVMSL